MLIAVTEFCKLNDLNTFNGSSHLLTLLSAHTLCQLVLSNAH